MNRRVILIVLLVVAGLLIIGNKSLRSRLLPNGKISMDKNADISNLDLSVTPAALSGRPKIEVLTSKGLFTIELRPDVAPKTVANFLGKWSAGYCDNKTFHRVEDWVVQGCDPKGDGTGGETNLPTENSSEPFTAGSVGVARKSFPTDVSNDSQFFVVKKDSTFLDGEYTYFGRVTSGMDVVNKLAAGDKILSTTILTK